MFIFFFSFASALNFQTGDISITSFTGNLTNLSQLQDTQISSPSNNEVLKYSSSINKWINAAINGDSIWQRIGGIISPINSGDSIDMLGGNITEVLRFVYNTTGCDEDSVEGTKCWNPDDKTENIVTGLGNVIQVGQEQWALAKNGDSISLLNGQVVTVVGSSGDRGLVARANAGNSSFASRLGVVTLDSCAVNAECAVTTFGRIRGLDTSSWTAGTLLYLSADGSGNLTSTVPVFPNFRVLIAFVVRSHATDGIIFVQPQLDYTDGVTLNDLYVRNNFTTSDTIFIGDDGNLIHSPESLYDINTSGATRFYANVSNPSSIAYMFCAENPSGTCLPRFIIQRGGTDLASLMVRSLGIINDDEGWLNGTESNGIPTNLSAYLDFTGVEQKIDFATSSTGADLYVGDDVQVSGDMWLTDTEGSWHFLTRTLTLQDRLFSNLVLNSFNGTLTGTNFTIIDKNLETLIINIDANETITDSATDSVTIVEGTNSTPVKNFIHYLDKANPTLTRAATKSSLDNAIVSQFIQGSGYTYASIVDEQSEDNAIRRIYDRFYSQGPLYISGYSQEATSTNINFSAGDMNIITHEHSSSNILDTDTGYFYIENGITYVQLTGLDSLDEYSDGTAIGNNKYFNVVFGIVHNDLNNQDNRMIAIVQEGTSEYTTLTGAETDTNQLTNFFTGDTLLNKMYLPIARVVMQRTGGSTNTIQALSSGSNFIDLRGVTSSSGGAAGSPSITDHSLLSNLDASSSGHTGFIFADGSIPLTADWDAAFNITAEQFKLGTDPTNHRIYDNSTCTFITGDTSVLKIC